jgi:hypothetical protein
MEQAVRPCWPSPPRDVIASTLTRADMKSLEERVTRAITVLQEFGPATEMLLVGGIEAVYALEEMRNCFVTANSMAVVFLAHAFIEHSLAGDLMIAGEDDDAQAGFAKITRRALETGRISAELFQRFERIRIMRNAYVHPKVGLRPGSTMKRFLDSGHDDPRDLADADALETVVDFLRLDSPS